MTQVNLKVVDDNFLNPPMLADELRKAVEEWGYFSDAIKNQPYLWKGKNILDIGMGGGPHSIGFVERGARSYTGVDPLVGTDHVRDFRSNKNPEIPNYHAFPYSTDDIMNIHPNVFLYSGLLEERIDTLREKNIDVVLMSAVTEHLSDPEAVFTAIHELLPDHGTMWFSHCNYYSWSGHHYQPRNVAGWDRNNEQQNIHVDWQHLEEDHPAYKSESLNRMRLIDLRDLVNKYFEIIEWRLFTDALERLTPEIRQQYREISLAEMLATNAYVFARKRSQPLDINLSDRQFYHPSKEYQKRTDFAHENIEDFRFNHGLYFDKRSTLCSHSINNSAGNRVLSRCRPNDILSLTKYDIRLQLTVDSVQQSNGCTKLTFRERIDSEILNTNHDQWTLKEVI